MTFKDLYRKITVHNLFFILNQIHGNYGFTDKKFYIEQALMISEQFPIF